MLQQTRVETVIPYFERFLERFPDVASLAAAEVEDVLACWSGLGYYRRARALQSAAQTVMDEHSGAFPREREAVLALPGIGPYTAGAVLSIAFDAPEALVDGNVARVFSRIFELESELGSGESERALWRLAGALVPEAGEPSGRGPGAWNQALMELGATICTPRTPQCSLCPVAADCRALAAGRTDELPLPKAKPATVEVALEVLWACDDGRVLASQRPEKGRMAGLWELPTRELPRDGRDSPGARSASAEAAPLLFAYDFPRPPRGALVAGAQLGELRHGITKHRITLRVRAGSARGGQPRSGGADGRVAAWVPIEELRALALTGMTRKVLKSSFLPDAARS